MHLLPTCHRHVGYAAEDYSCCVGFGRFGYSSPDRYEKTARPKRVERFLVRVFITDSITNHAEHRFHDTYPLNRAERRFNTRTRPMWQSSHQIKLVQIILNRQYFGAIVKISVSVASCWIVKRHKALQIIEK